MFHLYPETLANRLMATRRGENIAWHLSSTLIHLIQLKLVFQYLHNRHRGHYKTYGVLVTLSVISSCSLHFEVASTSGNPLTSRDGCFFDAKHMLSSSISSYLCKDVS